MTREVIVVAGLASKGENLAPLRYTAEKIAGETGVISYVDGGVPNDIGGYDVATPTEQVFQIAERLEAEPGREFIIVSQSMGALATLTCVEAYESLNLKAISISPPLTHPDKVARHPRIIGRIKHEGNSLILPSYSFALADNGPTQITPVPVGLRISSNVYDDIDAQSPHYLSRTIGAVRSGALHIVMPTQDWNTSALTAAGDLPSVHFIEGPHSLQTDQALLDANIETIARLADR